MGKFEQSTDLTPEGSSEKPTDVSEGQRSERRAITRLGSSEDKRIASNLLDSGHLNPEETEQVEIYLQDVDDYSDFLLRLGENESFLPSRINDVLDSVHTLIDQEALREQKVDNAQRDDAELTALRKSLDN